MSFCGSETVNEIAIESFSLMNLPYSKYSEYHTSFDNKKILSLAGIKSIASIYLKFFEVKLMKIHICVHNKIGRKQFSLYILVMRDLLKLIYLFHLVINL